jgi:hypothetical protein
MFCSEIPTSSDLIGPALERAESDLPKLRAALNAAEAEYISAKGEVDRLSRKQADLNRQAKALREACKKYKSAAMEAEAMDREAEAKKAWSEFGSVRVAYQRCCDSLAYLVSWVAEDANLRLLEAELAERIAQANLLDGKACTLRCRLLATAALACANDPGSGISVQGSQSQGLLQQAGRIRTEQLPKIEAQIKQHKARVSAERNDVSARLFHVAA